MIRTLRSLVEPSALTALVHDRYDLPVETCTLVRSLNNDVYVLEAGPERYVLKVYGPGGWSLGEVLWEQEYARHLAASGVAVAPVVALADGRLADVLDAAEGPRPFALFGFVRGDKPAEPFDDPLYHELGRLIAQLHTAGLAFATELPRRAMDLRTVLEEPLELVLPRLVQRPAEQRLVDEVATAAGQRIAAAGDGLAWGIRHGDVSPDNTHRGAAGLVLHDFDQSAPGWLTADLTGVSATEHWPAFLDGYRQVRPVTTTELEALPWLGVTERVANLAFHLVVKPALRGTESLEHGWVDRELAGLREAADTLL